MRSLVLASGVAGIYLVLQLLRAPAPGVSSWAWSSWLITLVSATLVGGFGLFLYKVAMQADTIWAALAIPLLSAGVMFFMAGTPSCEQRGPLGDCEVEADNGYDATMDDRLAGAGFFLVILGPPALFGYAASEKRHQTG